MSRISVVVPIYNVEPYLETCLESFAQQSFADFEVVMVDDGSTDGSGGIAERFAERDSRFRLVTKVNAGLGAARNTGVEHASGEFLMFVDSDDLLRRHAFELMVSSLDQTGSDFVSGNVRRLSAFGTRQTNFLRRTFASTRLATHVTEFPALLADRIACNKLWRRSFYDEHDLRFPEGTLYEDVPMTIPAHFLAKRVDVLDQTVYLWRIRSGDNQSITQRRTMTRGLVDRAGACRQVSVFLASNGFDEGKRLYDRTVVAQDLSYFLGVLDIAGDEFRETFLDLSNQFLDEAAPDVTTGLPAIDRLKWHFVRRRDVESLLEVLEADRRHVSRRIPIRVGDRWYGDYPFRNDPDKEIPPAVYELDSEMFPRWRVQRIAWEGSLLHLEGTAHIAHLGAAERDSQRVELFAVGPREQTISLTTEPVHRPDVTANSGGPLSLDWSGFRATLDLSSVEEEGRPVGLWEIQCEIRSQGVTRRALRPRSVDLFPLIPLARPGGQHRRVTAYTTSEGRLVVAARSERAVIQTCSLVDGVLQLEGDLGGLGDATLELYRRIGADSLTYPVFVDRTASSSTFLARVPVGDLLAQHDLADAAAHADRTPGGITWDLRLGGRRVTLAVDLIEPRYIDRGRQISLLRSAFGNASIVERSLRHIVDAAEWRPDGVLQLSGRYDGIAARDELVLRLRGSAEEYAVPLSHDSGRGRFSAELTPGRTDSLAGSLPLRAGIYDLVVRSHGRGSPTITSVSLDHRALSSLPQEHAIGTKSFSVGAWGYDDPVLQVSGGRRPEDTGGHNQAKLVAKYEKTRTQAPLTDAVVYDGRHLGPYAGNLRALHHELVRRNLPLEHLWVVGDDAWAVPETAQMLRAGSAEHYDAAASARYVVADGKWREWFCRRPDQIGIQMGYSAPIKAVGADLADSSQLIRSTRRWQRQSSVNNHIVLSSGPFATDILSRVVPLATDGQIVESGSPAHDLMTSVDRDSVRDRLGLASDRLVVLYAPSYRDNLRAPGGHWMSETPDLDAMRDALAEDCVMLFRKHWSVLDSVPSDPSGFLRDVTRYPDVADLLVAADVVVSDYSTLLVSQAAAGRPTVMFAPDLERFRDHTRGLYLTEEVPLPGPVVTTTAQLIATLRRGRALRADFQQQVDAFASVFCPLADGKSAARVVDRFFR